MAISVIVFFATALGVGLKIPRKKLFPYEPFGSMPARAQIVNSLSRIGGKYLIIVRYWPDHDLSREWVYNEADIDAAKVVWARGMTAVEDQEVIEYFHDRKPLLLEADANPPHMSPYPSELLQARGK